MRLTGGGPKTTKPRVKKALAKRNKETLVLTNLKINFWAEIFLCGAFEEKQNY